MATETLKRIEENGSFNHRPSQYQLEISDGGGELAKREEEDEDEKKISIFIEKLRNLHYRPYLYQLENILESPFMSSCEKGSWYRNAGHLCDKDRDYVEGIDLGDVKHYSISQMREFTDNFSKDNFICDSRHGRVFRGQISGRNVVVKTLDFFFPIHKYIGHITPRVHDDIVFLRDPLVKSHPNFAKLIGYCVEVKIAFVFDVDPKATVDQLITSDEFGWEARMKVAMDFGQLLKLSHDNLIIYGSIDAKNIMIDQNWDTKFFEFGFHQRVKNRNDKIKFEYQPGPNGYLSFEEEKGELAWSMKSDLHAYGVLLLNLIGKKRQVDDYGWLLKEIRTVEKKSLVNDTFEIDEHTGSRITELAMSCLADEPSSRPDMETVIKKLEVLVGHTKLPKRGVKLRREFRLLKGQSRRPTGPGRVKKALITQGSY